MLISHNCAVIEQLTHPNWEWCAVSEEHLCHTPLFLLQVVRYSRKLIKMVECENYHARISTAVVQLQEERAVVHRL